jgi:hypothetical protein
LISDGIETCYSDPCKLVDIAHREGVNFTMHVIGVAVDQATRDQLSCMAEEGGGVYYDVKSADEFKDALDSIKEEHEQQEQIVSYADATETARPTATATPKPTNTPKPTSTRIPPTPRPQATRTPAPPVPPTPTNPTAPTPTTAAITPTPTRGTSGCVPPVITQFKAIPPPQGSTARFTLYYETQGASRVEIFGNALTPPSGTFDVWDDNTNYWVLWASTGDSNCYVEEAIEVDPDRITPPGSGLKDVDVDSRNVTISVRDHSAIDGDKIDLYVNGSKVLSNYTLTSSPHGVAVTLNSGDNKVKVTALNEGSSPPNTVEVRVSNVVRGSAVQISTGLSTGQSESFNIRAP